MDHQLNHPQILDLVVELGILRMRELVEVEPGQIFRPRICILANHTNGLILATEVSHPGEDEVALVGRTLDQVIARVNGMPRQILCRKPELVAKFKLPLAELGIDIVVRESLPMADAAIKSLIANMPRGAKEKGLLDTTGVTVDHIIAFAEAGQLFYEAKPWHYLSGQDLIDVESPRGPKGARMTQVLGHGGQVYGLGFVENRDQYEFMESGKGMMAGVAYFSLVFCTQDELPYEDGELFENQNLPLAGEEAYPRFTRFTASAGHKPPKVKELVWAEGLLRALAASTEAEFDHGRWEKSVKTIDGPVTYKFSMPILLEQLSGSPAAEALLDAESPQMMMQRMFREMGREVAALGRSPTGKDIENITEKINAGGARKTAVPTTPTEKAKALCDRAMRTGGRYRTILARQALEIDPDCCEAMLILAGMLSEDQDKIPALQQAVAAGERQLGAAFIGENTGHFWGLIETRPYMRALEMLGFELANSDRMDEAQSIFRKMLDLNPGDNQGIRYVLSELLLKLDKLDEADHLLNRSKYNDDAYSPWEYTRALLAFRQFGDGVESRRRLSIAMRTNRFIGQMLIGEEDDDFVKFIENSAPDMSDFEAQVESIRHNWEANPEALNWLRAAVQSTTKKANQWERARSSKAKKKKR